MVWSLIALCSKIFAIRFWEKISAKSAYLNETGVKALTVFKKTI